MPVQESQGTTAPHCGHEPDLPRSAQMVNHEKDLVPCEVGTVTRHAFEVAGLYMKRHVDHVIFRGHLLRHGPPFEERNELLEAHCCIVGATG